ncbi:hypothetical protein H6F44_17425 [Pseudanabaena sp. FACHB-1277]|uniref:PEP-CTERM sorting domain-containing protein n=1 Tax=Pseudanabaena cinerea FACHB-1277 TaxID=2949581 RepID=A0A926UW09_9CYAN|nr:choice-of-anchor R domain-containing protein [Pseudanabaena cinerea]MBD2151891.1 hypothetical protein [Pseudanabaena cinerea FACHB-1277]
MKYTKKWGGVAALLVSVLTTANPADAISLIGNYSSTNDGDGTNASVPPSPDQKAVGFTLPTGNPYSLDSIKLRLFSYNTSNGDVALLQIYRDSAKTSTSPNEATLESVTFTNPTSSSNAVGDFIFTPTSTFTFLPDTRYWLLVDATAGFYGWLSNFPYITPTGISGITHNGYQRSGDDGSNYFSSTTFSSFEIQATEVPFEFEASGGLAILGGAWLLRKQLQKRKITKD